MTRTWLPVAAVALGCSLLASTARAQAPLDISGYHMVDLTHAFDETTLYWPTSPSSFTLEQLAYGQTPAGFFYAAFALCTPEHGGTHFDAPIHFAEGRRTTAEVPLEQLVAPAIVIDVSAAAARDRNYRLEVADVLAFEARHGRITSGTIVLVRTDWSRFWPDRKAYLGDDTKGDASRLSFPGIGADAARLLVEDRGASALGIDTASIDHGPSTDFAAHRVGAARDVPNFENLTALGELPATGAVVVALPMKIGRGSGGPLRAIALVPRSAPR